VQRKRSGKRRSGESLKIPLKVTWRNEFNGTSIKVKAYGEGLSALKEFDIPIKAAAQDLVIDTAAMKLAPGDYTFALYSLGICKYGYNPAAVPLAEAAQKKAEQDSALAAAAKPKNSPLPMPTQPRSQLKNRNRLRQSWRTP
jgi:hypothetical protein